MWLFMEPLMPKKEHNLKSVGLQQYNKALIEQIYIYYI